jgi:hypothetical protein
MTFFSEVPECYVPGRAEQPFPHSGECRALVFISRAGDLLGACHVRVGDWPTALLALDSAKNASAGHRFHDGLATPARSH